MSKINNPGVRLKQGDGRVAELLVALINTTSQITLETGDINVNLDDLEALATITNELLQGVNGSVETPAILNTTSAGTVAAGAFSVSFYNKGTTDATVLGEPLEPKGVLELCAKTGNTFSAIAYVASATSELQIITTTIV